MTARFDFTELRSSVWHASATAEGVVPYLDTAFSAIQRLTGAEYLAVVRVRKGKWEPLLCKGSSVKLPVDLFADALDGEALLQRQGWSAMPLDPRGCGELFVLFLGRSAWREPTEGVLTIANLVNDGLRIVRTRVMEQRRIDRLEAILAVAAQWNRTQEMDELLQQMAETSTRLLGAERASIFLWDHGSKTLVGRPALGVEGDELRIPDDMGIVGQVVQTGRTRRVDADVQADQQEINRAIDSRLGFKTKTLLCAPLRGRAGQLFGAFEMINKHDGNFTEEDEVALEELATHAAIALENTQERQKLLKARNEMVDLAAQRVEWIGQCPAIVALRSTIGRVADTELVVLILGEHGTGKEVVSQLIHYLSRRRNEPLVAVNCAALTETLLESELFGHEKGAFTDARESRAGKFELASGGTLFLDEIGEMSLSGQAKLLRVLEEKVVVRVGGSAPIPTDVRVIAATNKDLSASVRERRFREDLFFRLNVVTVELPPLRERGDDVLLLADHFLSMFCVKARRKPPKFTVAARKRLVSHNWPGNIRELRNLMERLAYLSAGDKIDVDDLAFILTQDKQSPALLSLELPLTEASRQFQTEYIKRQIERVRGNMTEAAQRLGLHRSNLYRKMRQLGMQTDEP